MEDEPGCPVHGHSNSIDGITATEACCHCADDAANDTAVVAEAADASDGGR